MQLEVDHVFTFEYLIPCLWFAVLIFALTRRSPWPVRIKRAFLSLLCVGFLTVGIDIALRIYYNAGIDLT